MEKSIGLIQLDEMPTPMWGYVDSLMAKENTIVSTDESSASLEDLVNLCDWDAEAKLAHGFVGLHRLIGAVLYQQHGRESATKTMLRITKLGGLHGMSGIGLISSVHQILGLGATEDDWSGKFGD